MGNRITRTVLFAASALLSMSAFGAGAARFGTLRNSDWVVTNAWQAVSNKTHDLILEIGQGDSLPPNWQNVSNAAVNAIQSLQPAYDYTDNALISFSSTGIVFRSLSYGTPTRWTDASGDVWEIVTNPPWTQVEGPPYYFIKWYDDSNAFIISTYYVGEGWYIYRGDHYPERAASEYNATNAACYTNPIGAGATIDYVRYVRQAPGSTNLVGRVALTNDISQAISTNNPAFVSAVLAAPLVGADPNDLSELAEYGSYGTVGAALLALIAGLAALKRGKLDGAAAYPPWYETRQYQRDDIVSHAGRIWLADMIPTIGEEPGVGSSWVTAMISDLKQDALSYEQMDAVNSGATAAKVETWDGYAAQIAQKANATDLPYAMVTPGEWAFSELPSGYSDPVCEWNSSESVMLLTMQYEGDDFEIGNYDVTQDSLSVTFAWDEGPGTETYTVIATRASLPGHLCDRAVNAVSVTGATTLTLPALVNAGKARDFLMRLAISGSTEPTITFAAPTGETITYETDGDEFPVPDEAGTWLYSFTETAAGVFAVALKKVNPVTQGGS